MRELLLLTLVLASATAASYRAPSYAPLPSPSETPPVKDDASAEQWLASTTIAAAPPTISGGSSTSAADVDGSSKKPTNLVEIEATPLPAAANAEQVSDGPVLLPPLGGSMESAQDHLKRRIVTYDQRQEGQYNVRADLENFMILLIPPGPQEGMNLLDLLTKSNFRRASGHSGKSKRKHYATRTNLHHALHGAAGAGDADNGIEFFKAASPYKSAQRKSPQQLTTMLESIAGAGESHRPEYFEGRTPYRGVSAVSADATQPDRPVDVLPPPYYPELIKPFHLDAEPTLIQALPPADLNSYPQFLDGYQQASGNAVDATSTAKKPSRGGYYRGSRALLGSSYLETNRLSNSPTAGTSRSVNVPIYRAELGAAAFKAPLYPPVDAPTQLTADIARAWRLVDATATARQLSPHNAGNDFELELDLLSHDADTDNADIMGYDEAKLLLSDGLERCAPGRRRDSYGICREIEGY